MPSSLDFLGAAAPLTMGSASSTTPGLEPRPVTAPPQPTTPTGGGLSVDQKKPPQVTAAAPAAAPKQPPAGAMAGPVAVSTPQLAQQDLAAKQAHVGALETDMQNQAAAKVANEPTTKTFPDGSVLDLKTNTVIKGPDQIQPKEPTADEVAASIQKQFSGEETAAPKPEVDPYQAQLDDLNAKTDAAFNTYNQAVNQILSGTFPLTVDQQAQVDSMRQIFDSLKQQQLQANKNYTRGITQAGISAGRSRYAPQLALGEIQQSINTGLSKVADLEVKAVSSISELKQGFLKQDYEMINNQYDKLTKYLGDKSKTITDMQKNIQEQADKLRTYNQQERAYQDARADKQSKGAATQLVHVSPNGDVTPPSDEEIAATAAKLGIDEPILRQAIADRVDALESKAADKRKEMYANKPFVVGKDINGNDIYGQFDKSGNIKRVDLGGDVLGDLPGSMVPSGDYTLGNGNTVSISPQQSAFLSQLSPEDRTLAESIAGYQADPTKLLSMKDGERKRFIQAAMILNPKFDQNLYAQRSEEIKSFTGDGKNAQNIRSLNTAIGHLAELKKAAEELGNVGIRPIDAFTNWSKSLFGNPAVSNFRTAANAVAGEMATVFKGSGATDQEIESWKNELSSSSSPEQLESSINTMIRLMNSRIQSIKSSYEDTMGESLPYPILNAESQHILQGMGLSANSNLRSQYEKANLGVPYDDAVKKYGIEGVQKILDSQKKTFNQPLSVGQNRSSALTVSANRRDPSKVIAGFDFTNYATDPKWGHGVRNILAKMPEVESPEALQSYLTQVAPKSPYVQSPEVVVEVAHQTGIPVKLLAAIMQQESNFGTKGRAAYTHNPANVGNVDSGANVDWGNWKNGLLALARNINKRQIA